MNFVFFLSLVPAAFGLLSGCGPKYTYPADSVPSSIERVSKKDYGLEVTARVAGRTAGALFVVDDLLDEKGQIPKEIHENMGQIMQAVTRVALSTDLPLDFCVVVIRDRAHLNELLITRSLDDTKRANSDAIGVEESINRTLFGQGKYQMASEGEQSVFVLKEVKLESFLADQIAQRIRFSFAKDAKEENAQALILADGSYVPAPAGGDGSFRFSVLSLKPAEAREIMLETFKIVADVISGYKFMSFSEIEILDYLNRQRLNVDRQTFLDYLAKTIDAEAILDRHLTESASIQEAFKLFGFNLTDTADTETPPIAPATPS